MGYITVLIVLVSFLASSIHTYVMDESSYDYEPTTGQDVINCTYSKGGTVINCSSGEVFIEEQKDSGWREALDFLISVFLVLFAGTMSGLTMGLMSLDMTNLKIISKSGDAKAQKYAKKIMPLVRKHHLLLVTLLTANAIAMEALPIFLDRLVGPVFAIVLSVTLVLLFGEIIPQAICTRFGLAIGAIFSPIVWLLIVIFFPIGYPLGKLLDCLLGHESGTFYRRAELKELVGIHELTPDAEEGDERLTQGK